MSCEDTFKSEENNLGWYLKRSKERLLQGVKHVGILEFEKSCSKNDLKKLFERKENGSLGGEANVRSVCS